MENRNFIIGSGTCTLKVLGFAIFACLSCAAYSQVPTITSFSPTSGPAGTTVTIKGTNFDAAAGDNIVYFGAVQAKVFYSTTNSLMLNVPVGASCAPITVLVNGSMTYSAEPFVVTFSGGAGLGVKTDFTAGNTPTSVAMGDLDGDGYADLVVANKNSHNISVLRNSSTDNGNINFDAAVNYSTGSNSKPNAVAVGDLDNDGQLDVAVANMKTNSVSIFRNNSARGSGVISFDEKINFTTTSKPKGVAIGDLDGDGLVDLIFATQGGKSVSILKNISTGNGNISFDNRQDLTQPGSQLQSVVVTDFDGDTKPDLAVAGRSSNFVGIYKNTSTGTGSISFADPINLIAGSSPSCIASGDLDDDGLPDLVVTNTDNTTISLYRNLSASGMINFVNKIDEATGASYKVNWNPYSVAIADVTGDGKLDLVIGHDNSAISLVSVLENESSGSDDINFSSSIAEYTTGQIPKSVAIGDLNNDGKVDLATGDAGGNTVSVLKN